MAIKYLLFSQASPLWSEGGIGPLSALIADGASDSTLYRNCRELFDLIADGIQQGLAWYSREDFTSIARNRELVSGLWHTLTSQKMQWAAQLKLIEDRKVFLGAGAQPEALPLTAELNAQIALLETKQISSAPPSSGRQDSQPDPSDPRAED